jgi:hypothetical protein
VGEPHGHHAVDAFDGADARLHTDAHLHADARLHPDARLLAYAHAHDDRAALDADHDPASERRTEHGPKADRAGRPGRQCTNGDAYTAGVEQHAAQQFAPARLE